MSFEYWLWNRWWSDGAEKKGKRKKLRKQKRKGKESSRESHTFDLCFDELLRFDERELRRLFRLSSLSE
jgi:hypothetical protein